MFCKCEKIFGVRGWHSKWFNHSLNTNSQFSNDPYLHVLCNRIVLSLHSVILNRLAGLVVKVSASRAQDPGSNPTCAEIFPGSSHTSDFKIGTPVATLPGAWRYRVSTGTGWPSVSIL